MWDDHQLFLWYLHNHGVLYRVEQENLPLEKESPAEKETLADFFFEKAMPLAYSECTELNRRMGIFRLRELLLVLPRSLQPHEVVGIVALLGVIEKIPAGERSVFERRVNGAEILGHWGGVIVYHWRDD